MNKKLVVLNYWNLSLLCCLATFLLSCIFFIRKNAKFYSLMLQPNLEISVFLKTEVKTTEIIYEKIYSIGNFQKIEFISKKSVKNKLKHLKDEILLTDDNPFPDSFSLAPRKITSKEIQNIVNQLKQIDGIDEIRYDNNLVKIIENLVLITKLLEWILILCSTVVVVKLIAVLAVNFFQFIHFIKQKEFCLQILTCLGGVLISLIILQLFRKAFFTDGIWVTLSLKEIVIVIFLTIFLGMSESIKKIS